MGGGRCTGNQLGAAPEAGAGCGQGSQLGETNKSGWAARVPLQVHMPEAEPACSADGHPEPTLLFFPSSQPSRAARETPSPPRPRLQTPLPAASGNAPPAAAGRPGRSGWLRGCGGQLGSASDQQLTKSALRLPEAARESGRPGRGAGYPRRRPGQGKRDFPPTPHRQLRAAAPTLFTSRRTD